MLVRCPTIGDARVALIQSGLVLDLYTSPTWQMWNASFSKVVAGDSETILNTVADHVERILTDFVLAHS